jgi:hypothetical protein
MGVTNEEAVRAMVEELVQQRFQEQLEAQVEAQVQLRLAELQAADKKAKLLQEIEQLADFRTVGHSAYYALPLLSTMFNALPSIADLGKGGIPLFSEKAAGCDMLETYQRKNGSVNTWAFYELRVLATLVALIDSSLHGVERFSSVMDQVLEGHQEQLAQLQPALGGIRDLLAWAKAAGEGRYNCFTSYTKGGTGSLFLAWYKHFGTVDGFQFNTEAVRSMESTIADYKFKHHAKAAAEKSLAMESKQLVCMAS